jgi:holo-[acyl-carrier protein] synthase
MIFGIGTDIVELVRIEQAYERYGQRFARRILSADEWMEFQSSVRPANFLAKRFAAKESFAKAMGSGLREPVSMRRISVTHNALGKPSLQFDLTLQQHLTQLNVGAHHLSVSDERNLLVAFVVLEADIDHTLR